MAGIASARLGWGIKEFYESAPIEFFEALEQVYEIEVEKYKVSWEQAQYIVIHVRNMSGRMIKSEEYDPCKLGIAFAWQQARIQSIEEQKQIIEGLAAMFGGVITKGKQDGSGKIKGEPGTG